MYRILFIVMFLSACSSGPDVTYSKVNLQPLALNSSMTVNVELPYGQGDDLKEEAHEQLIERIRRKLKIEPSIGLAQNNERADYKLEVTIEEVDVGTPAPRGSTETCTIVDEENYAQRLNQIVCEERNLVKQREAIRSASRLPLQVRSLSTQSILIDADSGQQVAAYTASASGDYTDQALDRMAENIVEGALCYGDECS